MSSNELSSPYKGFLDGLNNILKNRVSIDITNETERSNLLKNFMKTVSMFLFVFISGLFIYYASTDMEALSTKTYIYGLLIIIPLAVGVYASTMFFNEGDTVSPTRFLLLGIALFVISIFGYFYSSASGSSLILVNYLITILIVLIILGGLAIFYFVFSSYLKKQTGAVGYIINLIFYIPCLFGDFVKYLKEQLGITPSYVFVLFILEIIFIILYLFVPKLINFIVKQNTTLLLDKPIFLSTEKVVANSSTFMLKDKPTDVTYQIPGKEVTMVPGNIYRNSNYCVSFWCFVNTGSDSHSAYAKESNIFNYANGKPKVVYTNDGKDHINKYIVYFTNNNENENIDKNRYELTLPLQKWHNFVFNYHDNHADLFVNGVLERTFTFTDNNVPLNGSDDDNITVGSLNGLNGAICNVNYYTSTLPSTQIINNYNMLMFSPPFI
jgi:hypothetical protein